MCSIALLSYTPTIPTLNPRERKKESKRHEFARDRVLTRSLLPTRQTFFYDRRSGSASHFYTMTCTFDGYSAHFTYNAQFPQSK